MPARRVMVRCPAVLRGSGFALSPQDDGRASNHALVAFAEPGGGEKARQKTERKKAGEEREQAHALDVIGVALMQAEPIVAVHDMAAAKHHKPRQRRRFRIVSPPPEAAAAGLIDDRRER